MKDIKGYLLLAILLVVIAAPNLQAAGMCTAEYATCEESGDQEPGGGGTGGSSTCKRCISAPDGYAYCLNPYTTQPSNGMVVSPCSVYEQCYWSGTTQCFYTCSGNACYWV